MSQNRASIVFETARPILMGLAYRMLGSSMEAEDAVQDTFLKWQRVDIDTIDDPTSWLATVCIRRCIDILSLARLTRINYVGMWLPEPIHTARENTPEEQAMFSWSLTTAFLLLLERLSPKERAAYLLHEIFGFSYDEVSAALGIQETACRKLVSRARSNIHQTKVRYPTPYDKQQRFLAAFQAAVKEGVTDQLFTLLTQDIELQADGGGKVPAVRKVLRGRGMVIGFIEQTLNPAWQHSRIKVAEINGALGCILISEHLITAVVSLAYNEHGEVSHIYIMRNPDKLDRLQKTLNG